MKVLKMTSVCALVCTLFLLSLTIQYGFADMNTDSERQWPVLKHYPQEKLDRLALPIGGIGTGTISLMGNGALRHWEIMNRPAKGFHGTPVGNRAPFFAIFMQQEGKDAHTRALMGPVDFSVYESMDGTGADNHGLPRFREVSFDAAYPFGQVHLADADVPVDVTLQAFNPMIPGDADASGIPIAVLRYVISNKTESSVSVSVCGSFENFIGADGSKFAQSWNGTLVPAGAKSNKNQFREDADFQGIYMYSDGVDSLAEQWGTMALSTLDGPDITFRTSLEQGGWGNDILSFWDDFSADGKLTEKPFTGGDTPRASLASAIQLNPGETRPITFFITWHFPNRLAWAPTNVGNYYTTKYEDAWDVVAQVLPELNDLEAKTVEWVTAFCSSDYPEEVKEAALFNLSTLRTQTCFRTADGFFFGWEGCNDNSGCCMGSCTHVWNYEQATAFLYGELARKMREIEFGYATSEYGLMSFRVGLPLDNAQSGSAGAADGQMGTIMKMYRDWQLSGDDEQLKRLWPYVKKALSFCWIEGGWDGDIDGVMEGCQHNTMDVEYYGPNPQMQFWYLGALRAAEEMAVYLGDSDFALTCRALFDHGSTWIDENLFNGEYYEHQVRTPDDPSQIAPGLTSGMGASDFSDPDYQLARGCLVDQLVGQYMAHICGLGYLARPEHIKKTLQSILKYNYRPSMHAHFNNMRSYALGNEAALLMASYPYERPKNPFPYFNEVMTGFEYTAAVGMLYEGMEEEGLHCIRNIRNRYDGEKRSPFDEAECGHHYARAMASWAAVLSLSGFHYSAVDERLRFDPVEGFYFWSNGTAYGMVQLSRNNNKFTMNINVLNGNLNIKEIILNGFGSHLLEESTTLSAGRLFKTVISTSNKKDKKDQKSLPRLSLEQIPRPPRILDDQGNSVRSVSFSKPLKLYLKSSGQEPAIYYTLDGSEPDTHSIKYRDPIHVNRTMTLKAVAYLDGKRSIRANTAKLYKFTAVNDVRLKTPASHKYPGHGAVTLIDGIRGSGNFHDGRWLGFEETDLEATIDIGKRKEVHKILIGCLNDPRSWIFLPVAVEIAGSRDGKKFTPLATLEGRELEKALGNENTEDFGRSGVYDLNVPISSDTIRYIKLTVKNIGKCPEGHPGAGGKAWLFVDEMIIE